MEHEIIKEIRKSVTLNVTGGRIDSFRELEKTSGTVRVYDGGCIGIAGCLGEPDFKELTAKAREALELGIPYPCKPEGAAQLTELREPEILPVADFLPTMQSFLDRLGELCPRFAFSNKIGMTYQHTEYRNSAMRRLVSSGRELSVSLVAQNRGSGNLFDTAFGWSGLHFDADRLLARFKKEYDAFYRPAELAPGRYPVVVGAVDLFQVFLQHFTADLYAAGASLLSGKLGQKVFSDKLTLRDDRNPDTAFGACFFDAEGCVAENFRPTLIENGVLRHIATTKKTAAQYGLPNLGTAAAAYDGVPDIGFRRLWLDPTAASLRELVPGKAIYVVVAAGGDVTPDGHYATPVQMAYLLEDGEPVGRLPDLNISGDFFDLFGRDYIGAVHDDPMEGDLLGAVVMDVEPV